MIKLVDVLLVIVLVVCSASSWAFDSAPRVILIAQNSGTEITDLLVPFSILSAAGADVEIVATQEGPVNLMNGLELLDRRSIQDVQPFDADLVIIPAVHHPDQEQLLDWLNAAHKGGATMASICDGVEVLAATGLLDGRRATGHFYSGSSRRKNYPKVVWLENARYVEDNRIFSTSGVSASAPASIRLVERFVGAEKAKAVALAYGIDYGTGPYHDSSQFFVRFSEISTGIKNWLMGLRKRQYNLSATELVDEYALSLVADSLGRTFRVAMSVETKDNIIRTTHGLRIRGQSAFSNPDWTLHFGAAIEGTNDVVNLIEISSNSRALATIFQHIQVEYGDATADFVGMQLELPRRGMALYSDIPES